MNEIKEYGLENKNGIVVLSSRILAKKINKLHKNILRDLDNIINKSTSSDLSSLIIL